MRENILAGAVYAVIAIVVSMTMFTMGLEYDMQSRCSDVGGVIISNSCVSDKILDDYRIGAK